MVANKSIKGIEHSQMALTLTIDAASIEAAYLEKMKKYAKDVQLNGFRKGKAPLTVLEAKFGTAVREESTFECMEENLKTAIEGLSDEEKPLPYSTPELQDEESLMPFKKDSDITFTVHYDVMPVFDLPQYTGIEVEVPVVTLSDEDVNKEVDKIREQNATVIAKDGAIEKGDIVTINYEELDENGEAKEETKREDFTFTVGTSYNLYKIDDELIGLKKGDEKTITKTFGDDETNTDLTGRTITLKVTVTSVKLRSIPALDDELAQDVKEEYKTAADLVADIKSKLQKNLEDKMEEEKYTTLMDAIVAKTTIDVPKSMVDMETEQNWKNFVKQSGANEEQLLKYFGASGMTKETLLASWVKPATDNLKRQLILEKIQKTEDFKPDAEEFKKSCDEQLKDIKDENQRKYYEEMIKDDLTFKMVIPFLNEKNTFKPGKTVSYEDFINGAYKLPETETPEETK